MFTRSDSDHAFGTEGNRNVTGTSEVTGRFQSLQVLVAATLAAYDDQLEDSSSDSLVGTELPVGLVIHGDFRSVQLSGGAVRLYNYSKHHNR